MLNSLLQNRSGINLLAQDVADFPMFTQQEWSIIVSLTNILASLHGATLQIERRSTTISSYIPIARTIISNFNRNATTGVLDFKLFRNTVAAGLESRLREWDDKK
jgi:hypothetical protein